MKKLEKYALFDLNGNMILPFEYDDILSFVNGMLSVKKYGQFGVIDLSGKQLFPFDKNHYKFLILSDGKSLIAQKKADLIHVYNEFGIEVFQLEADEMRGINESLITYKKNGLWGIVNEFGTEVLPCRFDLETSSFNEGLASIRDPLSRKSGCIDNKGNLVIDYLFDTIFRFRGGVAVVVLGTNLSYIDKTGKLLRPMLK